MAENHNHSLEALPPEQNGKQEQENEKLEGEEIEKRVTDSPPATESHPPESRSSDAGTLVVPSSLVRDHGADLQGSSTTHKGDKAESQELVGLPEMEIIVKDAVEEPQTRNQNQLRVSVCSTPLSQPSPTSVSQPLSSGSSPNIPEQRLSRPKVNSVHAVEIDKRTTSSGKTLSPVSVVRTSASDGYNWRKYGQKQVKSPGGSRSYYRCTHSDCCAKKIECCDHLGRVIDVVYRSPHSHAPPQKTDSTREIKSTPSNELSVENSVLDQSCRVQNDSDLSPSKEPLQEAPCNANKKQHNSSSGENGKATLKEENVNEPDPKRRMKKGDFTCLDSPVKPGKKPKLVVHAAGDVSISGDGYRWRKYGQKMVKGNPHPRNYYRCTSAGCPVRKHIETAVDNSDAVIITYKGVHDHDMPVPKKRHGPPSAPLVAAAAPVSKNNILHEKTDLPQNQKTSTQWSVDTEGELTGEAMDLGGEKAMESARTLLSIGFEIKPC